MPERTPVRPRPGFRRPSGVPRTRWRRAHLLALPHLRCRGVRAAPQHALHGPRRACGGADLHQSCLTKRGERSTGSTHREPKRNRRRLMYLCRPSSAPLVAGRVSVTAEAAAIRTTAPQLAPSRLPHRGGDLVVHLSRDCTTHNRKAARSIPWMPRSLRSQYVKELGPRWPGN